MNGVLRQSIQESPIAQHLLVRLARQQAELERDLGKVERWKPFQVKCGTRSQTTIHHTGTITHVALLVIQSIRADDKQVAFDDAFVHGALAIHDHGEVIDAPDGRDTVYDDRTVTKDQRETAAFRESIAHLPNELQYAMLEHYMLQYVQGRGDVAYDDLTRRIVADLIYKRTTEFFVFEAVEKLDYLFYALNEWVGKGNVRILVHVLRRQHAVLAKFARHFKGFGRLLYTDDFITWCEMILEQYRDIQEEDIPDCFAPEESTP